MLYVINKPGCLTKLNSTEFAANHNGMLFSLLEIVCRIGSKPKFSTLFLASSIR
jgi:hypothetical protein